MTTVVQQGDAPSTSRGQDLLVARLSANSMSMNLRRMKPRHAAALALVGWYLMTPPPMLEPERPGLSEPLGEWSELAQVGEQIRQFASDRPRPQE